MEVLVPPEASVLGLWMAPSPCVLTWPFLCTFLTSLSPYKGNSQIGLESCPVPLHTPGPLQRHKVLLAIRFQRVALGPPLSP
jgi:hypothetical protein